MKQNNKERNTFKKLGFILVIFAFLLSIGTAFAYWAGTLKSATKTDNNNIDIGYAEEVTTEIDLTKIMQTEGSLVPEDRTDVSGPNAVEQIDLEFNVRWLDTENQTQGGTFTGALLVVVDNIKVNNDIDPISALLNFGITYTPTHTITLNGDPVKVIIEITLTEPGSIAEYNAIKEANITFDVVFTVTP